MDYSPKIPYHERYKGDPQSGILRFVLDAAFPSKVEVIQSSRSINGKIILGNYSIQEISDEESNAIWAKQLPEQYKTAKPALDALNLRYEEIWANIIECNGRRDVDGAEALEADYRSIQRQISSILAARNSDPLYQQGLKALETSKKIEDSKEILEALNAVGISTEINPENGSIHIDPSQPDLDRNIGLLMDKFKPQIMDFCRSQKVDYIIARPDGSLWDKEQAAQMLAKRAKDLEPQRLELKALDDAIEELGVRTIVGALNSPRNGFGGRGVESSE